jgi:hypothetical protein
MAATSLLREDLEHVAVYRRYAIASKPDLRKAAAKLAAIQGER